MNISKVSSVTDFYSPPQSSRITSNTAYTRSFDGWYFESKQIDSVTAAKDYPNNYCLIAVEEQNEYGISTGKLLCVANSLNEIDFYVLIHGGLENVFLSYVTGENLH